jgi:hypothetical protein
MILLICEIAKLKIANITCLYLRDKWQKFASAEKKTSYTLLLFLVSWSIWWYVDFDHTE